MKNITVGTGALLVLVLAGACLLAGCSSDSSGMADRVTVLEAEVQALKAEARVREKAFREELAMIRVNLDGIQSLLEVEKGRAEALAKPEDLPKGDTGDLDEQIDTKAKTFVKENLDRLLAITKKLLDKMERELDEQTKEQPPASKGDEI